MAETNKDIERLIVRGLDGELDEDEQLMLDRELIRDPEARRLMEEYERIDELAGAALNHALGESPPPLDPATLPDRSDGHSVSRYRRGWWLVPGAIAAALLAVFVARFPAAAPSDSAVTQIARPDGGKPVPVVTPTAASRGLMRNAGTHPSIKRNTGRDVLGVIGQDGNIYWIEVNRTRTIKRAAAPEQL